ncbi:MAG TPA: hypothetical protein VFA09_16820 [Ktedonobacteraceae bacterium]|nr:hypothetical protein [Ktedonobacteraceae bacterium]
MDADESAITVDGDTADLKARGRSIGGGRDQSAPTTQPWRRLIA